jgi:hypothetical protein
MTAQKVSKMRGCGKVTPFGQIAHPLGYLRNKRNVIIFLFYANSVGRDSVCKKNTLELLDGIFL